MPSDQRVSPLVGLNEPATGTGRVAAFSKAIRIAWTGTAVIRRRMLRRGALRAMPHFAPFQKVTPGSFIRTDQSVPPAVTKSRLKSPPPKAQLVHSSRGIGITSRSLPDGEKT